MAPWTLGIRWFRTWFEKMFIIWGGILENRYGKKRLCDIFSQFFSDGWTAYPGIEEINRRIYSDDLVINQKHLVDPAVQELSHIFSIYLRSSPVLSVVIMFNCNQSTGFGIIDLRHSENSSLLTSFKWKFAIFYPADSLAIPNLFSFNSVQHILHFCPQLTPKREDWKLVNFFFVLFFFIVIILSNHLFTMTSFIMLPLFSLIFNCFFLYTSLVCQFLLWTVSVHRVFLLN